MADGGTVRITRKSKELLKELSRDTGTPMVEVLDSAIEDYRRRMVLEETNRAYGRLRSGSKDRNGLDPELAAWDTTLADGLEPDGYSGAGEKTSPKKKRKSGK